jgi:hypothetical protein
MQGMDGIFSSTPRTLMDAIAPIRGECVDFDWAIQLQSGPFREIHFTDQDDPRNVLELFHEFSGGEPAWFRPGILPAHAEHLVQDEWSYYFGFQGDARKLCDALDDDISPRRQLFDVVQTVPGVYLIFVDDGWWEAYSTIEEVVTKIRSAWRGEDVESSRWEDGLYPRNEWQGQ